MKVLLISLFRPSRHNLGGPSSLIYYLSQYRPSEITLDLMYYENEKSEIVKDDLNEIFQEIQVLPKIKLFRRLLFKGIKASRQSEKWSSTDISYIPTKKQIRQVASRQYDLIWIYPNLLFHWHKQLDFAKTLMTGPDCSLLFFARTEQEVQKGNLTWNRPEKIKFDQNKKKSIYIENYWVTSSAEIHVVGQQDLETYQSLGKGTHAFFSSHPHFEYLPIKKRLNECESKITVLVSGANGGQYMLNYFDRISDILASEKALSGKVKIVLLGKNFSENAEKLRRAGYEVDAFEWVADYESLLQNVQIQLFPIAVGSGTKGKVLCALATGLLCVGTDIAFENIEIDLAHDALLFSNERQIPGILEQVFEQKEHYTIVARGASEKVRTRHNPQVTSEQFWNILKSKRLA